MTTEVIDHKYSIETDCVRERTLTETIHPLAEDWEPKIIDFNDILNACQVEPDYDYDPFDCDGLEHQVMGNGNQHYSNYGGECPYWMDMREMYGYFSGRNGSGVIVIDKDQARRDGWGGCNMPGASKQVREELLAQDIRNTIDYIRKWYNGVNECGWGVTCDFMGEHDSCWGYDDIEYAEEKKVEHAMIVADMLTDSHQGIIIENLPDAKQTAESRRNVMKWNRGTVHEQDWKL